MNNSQDRQNLELKALHYVDAQAAGDVETMAALWDEACDDEELERILSEIDEGLYSELAPAPLRNAASPVPQNQPAGQWIVAGCVAGLIAATVVFSVPISATRIAGTRSANVSTIHPDGLSADAIATNGIASGLQGTDAVSFSWPLHNSLSVGSSLDAIE